MDSSVRGLGDRRVSSFPFAIPLLRTPRLVLREPRPADFEGFAADAADPLSRAHLGGAITRREAWNRHHGAAGGWVIDGMGWWTVELAGEGSVGSVGVFRRENTADVEIGWMIQRAFWGRGVGTEAAGAALGHAIDVRGLRRVVAYIPKGNDASVRVATKIGMEPRGEAEFYGTMELFFVYER